MIDRYEDMKDRAELVRREFKDHIAIYNNYYQIDDKEKVDEISVLYWKKPETGINAIKYILHKGGLFVSGDLGEAIYRWSSGISWKFLSDLSNSYFMKKCEASEVGRYFEEWNEEEALRQLKECADQEYFNWDTFKNSGGEQYLYDKNEWIVWLNSYDIDRNKIFGSDAWEWVYSCGNRPHIRFLFHKIGLEMAYKQLEGKKEK